jgi:hypothetical protein
MQGDRTELIEDRLREEKDQKERQVENAVSSERRIENEEEKAFR